MVLDYGWTGLLIEGDAAFVAAARERYAGRPVTIHEDYVNTDNIVGIFRQHHVPVAPDLLSIDIDGNDYWLWLALAEYRPRIVVIEFNGTMPATRRWVMKYNPDHRWGGSTYFGASLASLATLGRDLGYALLGTDRNGVNAFFIRRDLLELSRFPEVTPEQGFHPLFIVHPYADGPFIEL